MSHSALLLSEKIHAKFDPKVFDKVKKYSVIRLQGISVSVNAIGERQVLVLRNTFDVIYTGLRRLVGAPQEYQKNKESNNFPTNYELAIPVEETN